MKRFTFNSASRERIARNNDPMHKKKEWLKSYYCAAVLAAFGLFFVLALGPDFLVFGCVLLAAAVFVFVDGLIAQNRK